MKKNGRERTFNFGADDVDLGSEERRRSEKSDPVAVTHLQAVNFGDFVVAAVAVAELWVTTNPNRLIDGWC